MIFREQLRLKTRDRLVEIKATIIEWLQHARFYANISFLNFTFIFVCLFFHNRSMTYFLFVSCTLNLLYISKIYNKHI